MNNKHKAKWDRLAEKWVLTGPPASPSEEDISHYQQLLEEGLSSNELKGKIILLGCTPSLRLMFSESNFLKKFDIYCVDFSELMYKKTSKVMNSINEKEKFIFQNWLDFEIGENAFDAVIGDKIIDNIMPEEWKTLIARIDYHLTPGGVFITHLAPQNMSLFDIRFLATMSKWANRLQTGDSLNRVVSGFWEQLLGASAFENGEKKFRTQKISRYSKEVDALLDDSSNLSSDEKVLFLEFVRLFWDNRDDEWSSYLYDEIIELLQHYFIFEKKICSTDYLAGKSQPIIRMRKELK